MIQEHELNSLVLMHGPCFSGSGDIIERMVTKRDQKAYERAGYVLGASPVKTFEDAVEAVVSKQADVKPSGKAAKK